MTVRIETLQDVLPHLIEGQGIRVFEWPNMTVVDYTTIIGDTFSHPVHLECRGLKFDRDGAIIARPLHKFFNIGEKERPEDVDWSRPHIVQDKLDGSMVHPAMLDGEMVFMTRRGPTYQGRAAKALADVGTIALCAELIEAGITPVFEYTGPENRIVVAYEEARLTLLAAREMVSGAYLPHAELERLGAKHGVPTVGTIGRVDDHARFITEKRALSGIEGFVIVFDDGHRIKLKTDGYVLRHRALAGVRYEKNLLAWVAEDAIDDVMGLLPEALAADVDRYRNRVNARVEAHLDALESHHAANKDVDRKTYALGVKEAFHPALHPIAFAIADGKDARAGMKQMLLRTAHTESRLGRIRDLFDMEWDGDAHAVIEE